MTLKTGKLDIGDLEKLLKKYVTSDPQVVMGPRIGEDAAVIDPGKETGNYWVVTSDPITLTTEEIGYYGVVVNLNDIATRGAVPRWFSATLLFPERSDSSLVRRVFTQVHRACRRFGISIVGGHTEVTPAIDRMILSGHMIGEVRKDRLVTTAGARIGDLLLLSKGICIEGTSIIAREKEAELKARGFSTSFIQKAKRFVFIPGIEVFGPARVACNAVSVHSIHDPTEGGLINGIIEMAFASGKEIEVDLERVPIHKESQVLCREYGLNPLGVVSSGALLLTLSPSEFPALQKAFNQASVPFQVIGKVKKGRARVVAIDGKRGRELKPFSRDEILKIY